MIRILEVLYTDYIYTITKDGFIYTYPPEGEIPEILGLGQMVLINVTQTIPTMIKQKT